MEKNLTSKAQDSCCCRRHFLKGLIGGSISISFSLPLTQPAEAANHAQALVLSCIDFRFINYERSFLKQKQLGEQYDWLALAGASLALAGFPHPAEAETFWDQLDLSYRLHNIKKVIILDHQDCGAYASKIDPNLSQDPQREEQVHQYYLSQAHRSIKERYPSLEVELYWVKLDGEAQAITPQRMSYFKSAIAPLAMEAIA